MSSLCGTRLLFLGLTPDLRPGLTYAAPSGADVSGSFCLSPSLGHRHSSYPRAKFISQTKVKIPTLAAYGQCHDIS